MRKRMNKIAAAVLIASLLLSSTGTGVLAADTSEAEEAVTVAEEEESEDYKAVKEQYAALDDYDGKSILQDITFPAGSDGVIITYESSQENILTSEGHIVAPVSQDTPVVVTALLQKNEVVMERKLQIVVLSVHNADKVAAELGKKSKERMLELCEKTVTQLSANDKIAKDEASRQPGQRSQASLNVFKEEIAAAKTMSNGHLAANRLMQAGIVFMESVKTDNSLKEGEEEKSTYRVIGRDLVYSTYRARLESYVFQAKALLNINPELVPVAAQRTVEQQITRAEQVLEEDYEHPYVKTREFYYQRDDEAIQYVTDARKWICNFVGTAEGQDEGYTWGIVRAMYHYKKQNVLSDCYAAVNADVKYATQVSSSSIGPSAMSRIGVGGTGDSAQYGLVQFDLSSVPDSFQEARLRFGGGSGWLDFYMTDNYSWPEVTTKNLFNTDGTARFTDAAGHFNYNFANSDTAAYAYVTNAAAAAAAKTDKTLTLAIGGTDGESVTFNGTSASDAGMQLALQVQLDTVDRLALQKKCRYSVKTKGELLEGITGYTEKSSQVIGQYSQESIDGAREALEKLEAIYEDPEISPFTIGIALADLHTKVREMRDSICLRTQVEQDATVFYGKDDLKTFRNTYKADPTFLDIKKNVDKNDLKTVKEFWEATGKDGSVKKYNDLLDKYPAWVTEAPANYVTTPEGTASAYITLTLEGEDNETNVNGIGHAWVDALTASKTVDGEIIDLALPNPSFEDGTDTTEDGKKVRSVVDKWTSKVTGRGKTGVYNRSVHGYGLAKTGNYSIYMENPDKDSSVTWTSSKFSIDENQSYTFSMNVRNMGIMEHQGITMNVHYLDADGNALGTSSDIYNTTKSFTYPFTSSTNILMQQAAICYTVTGDKTYAEYAKYFMSIFLNDHLQGTNHWQLYGWRPNGIDQYGAVQAGRNAGSLANTYASIRSVDDLYTEEEREYLMRQYELLTDYIMDIRDRMEIDSEEETYWGGNWEMDEASGACQLAMAALDDGSGHAHLDYSVQYIENGKRINQEQMRGSFREDGGWPESIRYHVEVVQKFGILAKAYRNIMAEDIFSDPAYGIAKSMEFLVNQQTPSYGGKIAYSPFGDDNLSDGNAFFPCGLYYDEVYHTDPALGLKLYVTWVRAGRPLPGLWNGEQNYAQLFFGRSIDLSEYDDQWAEILDLKSSDATRYWGNFIMRNNFKSKETFLSFSNFEKGIGHNHYDQLSFIMYADNVPLLVDPGIYSYQVTHPYRETPAHTTIQWGNEQSGYYAGGPSSSVNKDWYTSDAMDFVAGATTDGAWTRNLAFWKGGFEAFIIWDKIDSGTTSRANFMLSTSKNVSDGGITFDGKNKITAKGFHNVDLEMTVLKGKVENYYVEEGLQGAGSLPIRANRDIPVVDMLRIPNDEDYFTVLFPKTSQRGSLDVSEVYQEDGVTVALLSHSKGNKVYVAVNNDQTEANVKIADQTLVNARTGNTVDGSNVTVPAGTIAILYPQGQNNETYKSTAESGSSSTGGAAISPGSSLSGGGGGGAGAPVNNSGSQELPAEDASIQVSRNMVTGQKGKINAPATEGVTIQYTSGNEEVATVSDTGDIETLSAGETDLSVYVTKDGITTKTVIHLTVKDKKEVPDTIRELGDIRVSSLGTPVVILTKTMKKKQKSTFRAVNANDADITYSVADISIAKISKSGRITAKKAGKTNITVKVVRNGKMHKYRLKLTVKK